MANAYLNAAYKQDLPAGQKAVLIALANRADEETGTCFPGVRLICSDTGYARSTVFAHIKELVIKQQIKRENQERKDGSRSSNLYTLLIKPIKQASESVKKAKKKAKKAVKKTFKKAVDMGNKVFNGKNDVKPMTDASVLNLEYDNADWDYAVESICKRACEELINAPAYVVEMLEDAVYEHCQYWMDKAKDSNRLKLTTSKLRATFIKREQDFLEGLNKLAIHRPNGVGNIFKSSPHIEDIEPCHRPYNSQLHEEQQAAADNLRRANAKIHLKEEVESELGHGISFEEFQANQDDYITSTFGLEA